MAARGGLAIASAEAAPAGGFPQPHRDPFDRMIAAQGLLADVPVVGTHKALAPLGAAPVLGVAAKKASHVTPSTSAVTWPRAPARTTDCCAVPTAGRDLVAAVAGKGADLT